MGPRSIRGKGFDSVKKLDKAYSIIMILCIFIFMNMTPCMIVYQYIVLDLMVYLVGAKESAVAKSKGNQDELDMTSSDAAFLKVLNQKKKIPKNKANYSINETNYRRGQSCVKCKFNLGDEGRCHLVNGKINNDKGISKFFSPKGDGMLPGDIVWMSVRRSGKKLKYSEGHVIKKGARSFQCKDCKYYLYSGNCLLIEGKFKPKMSCGFIVKLGEGTLI